MSEVQVVSLASGSSGNALVIAAGETRVLVDAGISARRIARGLAALGLTPAQLDGILITHEHRDHVSGLETLARRYDIPCFLTAGTARALPFLAHRPLHVVRRGATFDVGRAMVTSMPVQHDAVEPCGFVIEIADTTVAVFTDLGCPEPHLLEPIAAADLVVLEANHDLDQLWNGPYPWHLKRRIASTSGHLCNDDCADLLTSAIQDDRQRTIWLAHLSVENNTELAARTCVTTAVAHLQATCHVLPRYESGPVWSSTLVHAPAPAAGDAATSATAIAAPAP